MSESDLSVQLKTRPPRPPSAVSTGVGMAGLVGVAVWMTFALTFDVNPVRFWLAEILSNPDIATAGKLDGPWSSAMNVIFCGVPMVLWSVLVDKVHRNPTTGLDWDSPAKPWRETLDTSVTKLAGLWATWAIIAGLYCIFRFYWRGNYVIAMDFYKVMAAPAFVLSIVYVFWIDTRLKEPKDSAWHLGALLMGTDGWDKEQIYAHFRSWAVKGFFLAFMISIVPPNFESVVGADFSNMAQNPADSDGCDASAESLAVGRAAPAFQSDRRGKARPEHADERRLLAHLSAGQSSAGAASLAGRGG